MLEYTVNTNIDEIPRRLSMVSIEIPDDDIEIVSIGALPGRASSPAPDETKTFGTNLLRPRTHLVIQLPSVVIPRESNYILNPLHLHAVQFRISEINDFVYDIRIKSM